MTTTMTTASAVTEKTDMNRPKLTIQNVLASVALAALIGGGFVAIGFRMETPAEVQGAHVEEFHDHLDDFEQHVSNFDTFIVRDIAKDENRAARTQMVEAQVKLTCLRTGADTLVMLDLMDTCGELGVPRR